MCRMQMDAILRSEAVIQFDTNGTILEANEAFLETMHYRLGDIKGRHHAMFVDKAYAHSEDYKKFWRMLRSGKYHTGQYMRFKGNGDLIWLQATYHPLLDENGRPFRIMKIASDISEAKNRDAYLKSQLEAISRSQAIIEFTLDGTIMKANQNFLKTMGYRLEDIKGRHHAMFVDRQYAGSPEYRQFWARLGRGEYFEGQYERIKANGDKIWLQATYNPVLGPTGKPTRIVKFATDITDKIARQKNLEEGIALIQGDVAKSVDSDIYQAADMLVDSACKQGDLSTDITGAIEEMIQTIAENSKTTGLASQVASKNGEDAKKGAAVVEKTIEKIKIIAALVTDSANVVDRLGVSSTKIGDIVRVIEEIAKQTNLLALNAAIEAARAGSQGKGFAVVADEVRKLAERTSTATKEISDMIQSIQDEASEAVEAMNQGRQEVEEGIMLADQAGDSLHDIVSGSNETVNMIAQIAAASEEQSATSSKMTLAIDEIAACTKSVADVVETISREAVDLRKLIKQVLSVIVRLAENTENETEKSIVVPGDVHKFN